MPAEPADPNQILPPEQAYLVTDMLRAVVLEGTGTRARSLGKPVAGKTGTTNDQADAWFVGFSPDVATGVWVGFDEIKYLGHGETGAHAALPIWVDYMRAALDGRPTRDFTVPPNGTGDAVAALFTAHFLASGRDAGAALAATAAAIYAVLDATRRAGTRELAIVGAQDAFVSPERPFAAVAVA